MYTKIGVFERESRMRCSPLYM